MKFSGLIVGLTCLLIAGGCKNNDGGPAGSGSGRASAGSGTASGTAASATSTTGAKSAACPAGAWKEPSGLFCLDAKGFTPGELKKNEAVSADDPTMEIYFTRAAEAANPEVMFKVSWSPKHGNTEAATMSAQFDIDYKNNTGEDKGMFAASNGKYVVWSRKDDAKSHKLYAIAKGNQHAYSCEASSYDKPIDPAVIAACKTLLPTD